MVICRACLTSKGMLTNLLNNQFLIQSFFNLTTILVKPDDKLPKSLCASCLKMLQDFHKFRDKIIHNHHFLLRNIPEASSTTTHFPETRPNADHLMKHIYSDTETDNSNNESNRSIIETDSSTINTDQSTIDIDKSALKAEYSNMDTNLIKIKTEPVEDEPNESVNDTDYINETKHIDIHQVNIKTEPIDNEEQNTSKDYLIEINIKEEFVPEPVEEETKCKKELDEDKNDETNNDKKETERETRLRKRKIQDYNEEDDSNKQRKTSGATKKKGSSQAGKSGSATPRKTVYSEMDRENIKTIKLSKEEQLSRQIKESENPKYTSMPFKCTKCFKGFLYERKLTTHTEKFHKPNSEFECYICSRTMVNSASLEQHLKKHATVFQCKACDTIFPEKERAIVHYKTVHEGDITQYPCQDCGKNFTNRRTLLSHIRVHHMPSEKPRCDICDKSFVTKATYETHMVIHTGELNYSCNICDKRFRLPDGLRSHLTIHTDDQPFYCSQCNVGFKRRDTYKQHFLTTLAHATDEIMAKHRCKTCGRKFATAYGLRKHLTLHDDTRYTCDVCGASVPVSGRRYHRHAGDGDEERVVCDHCGRGFKTRQILKKHIVTVHAAVRPFVCKVCGVKFSQSCSLRNHLIRRHKAPEDIADVYEPGTSS